MEQYGDAIRELIQQLGNLPGGAPAASPTPSQPKVRYRLTGSSTKARGGLGGGDVQNEITYTYSPILPEYMDGPPPHGYSSFQVKGYS